MVLPSPGLCHWGWIHVLLISPKQSLTSSLQILLMGQEKREGFALPNNIHAGCVHPARCECATGYCCTLPWSYAFSLSEIAFGYWLPERCKPERAPARGVIQGAIWLIRSLSLSPSREVHDCPMQRTFLTRLRQELGGTVNRAWLSHL